MYKARQICELNHSPLHILVILSTFSIHSSVQAVNKLIFTPPPKNTTSVSPPKGTILAIHLQPAQPVDHQDIKGKKTFQMSRFGIL